VLAELDVWQNAGGFKPIVSSDDLWSREPSTLRSAASPEHRFRIGANLAGVILGVGVLPLATIALYPYIPERVFSKVDITSLSHLVREQQESPKKRNTALGSAFTLASIPLMIGIAVALVYANEPVEQSAVVPLQESLVPSLLRVSLRFPADAPDSNYTCSGMTVSAEGVVCDRPLEWQSGCEFVGSECRFAHSEAVLTFNVPWWKPAVDWQLSMVAPMRDYRTVALGRVMFTLDGQSNVSRLESEPLAAVMQVMPCLRNDTVNQQVRRPLDPAMTSSCGSCTKWIVEKTGEQRLPSEPTCRDPSRI
jgi:hypothetical protein